MNKTDTENWKEFIITDFFEIIHIKNKLSKLDLSDTGVTPVHSSETFNNGIIGFTQKKADFCVKNDEFYLIFGDHTKSTNMADYNFCVTDNVKVLKPKTHDKKTVMYIITVWKKAIPSLGYARHWNVAKDVKFKLPVDKTGSPDFGYMKSYMQNLESAISTSLTALWSTRNFPACNLVKNYDWKPFAIEELFTVVKGTRLTKANMRHGEIRFIGASAINNGVTAYVSNNEKLHPANTITITYNGSVGEAFYQDKEFWASDDVNVLYPKFEMNQYIALFIIPLLKVSGKKYAFIDKWKKDVMEKDIIFLPVSEEGTPNFTYMEKYMKSIAQMAQKKLELLMARKSKF